MAGRNHLKHKGFYVPTAKLPAPDKVVFFPSLLSNFFCNHGTMKQLIQGFPVSIKNDIFGISSLVTILCPPNILCGTKNMKAGM